jgi:hypothetical protein
MPKQPRDPFEIKLNDEQRTCLALFVCDELQKGLDANGTATQEVDYWHQLYEQARTRQGRNAPWPDAADLTSYLASEKVDALQARMLRAIFTDPIWTVEGWGDAADRAPFVEEFHQWKAEEERLQHVLDRLILISLIEPRGLLEISEGTELRTIRKRIMAKVETDPMTGGMVYNEDMEPQAVTDEEGNFVEAGGEEIALEQVIDSAERVRTGPVYRILPYRDSVILPGHARDRDDIWGYGKRFWRRYGDLQRKADAGVYDKAAIEKITATTDREGDPALNRAKQDVAPQENAQAEKELWELLILLDINLLLESRHIKPLKEKEFGGERWYLVTVHQGSQQLLRVQHDDLERSRFVPVILFPRSDRATEGFSLVGHKLITTIEEHTAWRNMAADRAALAVQAPIKRVRGALWDPYEQPWGPKAVIDVGDPREVEQMQVADVPASIFNHIQMQERTAERIVGVNDIASGSVNEEDRTLGEVQMASGNSEIRMDAVLRRFQEAMETIWEIRHAIWKRALAERQDGEEPPASFIANLEGRGISIDQYLPERKVNAAMLEGAFRGKPRGSVETADPNRMRQDLVMGLQMLPALLQAFPMLQMMFQTPQAARAMGRQFLRYVMKVDNQQAFLGSPAQDLLQTQMLGQIPPMMAPGMPGPPANIGMQPQQGPPQGGPPQQGAPLDAEEPPPSL